MENKKTLQDLVQNQERAAFNKELDEMLADISDLKPPITLGEALELKVLSSIYRLVLGNQMLPMNFMDEEGKHSKEQFEVLSPEGTFMPTLSLPKEFMPFIEAFEFKSLDKNEYRKNRDRYREVFRQAKEKSISDILWYRQLFFDLEDVMVNGVNNGILESPNLGAIQFHISTGIAATALSQLLYEVSKQKTGNFTYILGIDDNGRLRRKALPGLNLMNLEQAEEWLNGMLALGKSAVTFYSMDPDALSSLVKDGEVWSYRPANLLLPLNAASRGFDICDQFLRFGQANKSYHSPHPHEVIIRSGGIETITVMDRPEIGGVVYKIKYSDGKIKVGSVKKGESESYSFMVSDYTVRGWVKAVWTFQDYGDEFALVGAIVRDMFVCEEKDRFYKIKGEAQSKKARHVRDPTIIWLPRFKINYYGENGGTVMPDVDPSELEERIISVVPAHVPGHPRRLNEGQNPNPRQLDLAKQYGVIVPQGYTFVKPHDRSGYEAHLTLYKSRSALQVLAGLSS